MAYNDNFNPADNMDYSVSSDEHRKISESLKKGDKGYNILWRMVLKNDKMKRTKIEVYTTSGHGCHIRDAETGAYYKHLVGTADEDLYFSVILATGECNSANGSSTLFYLSPNHYMTHLKCELEPILIARWKDKHDARLEKLNILKQQRNAAVVVK